MMAGLRFSALQNFDEAPLLFYAFDPPVLVGEDLKTQTLKIKEAHAGPFRAELFGLEACSPGAGGLIVISR